MHLGRTNSATRALRALIVTASLSFALGACASIQELNEELFSETGIFRSRTEKAETGPGTESSATAQAASDGEAILAARVLQPPVPRRKPENPERELLQTAALGESDFDALEYDALQFTAANPSRQKDFLANPDPERLIGMGFSDAIAHLGVPKGQREEPPARIWSYRSDGCSFNLFFFPGLEESAYRVLTYEVIDYRLKSESGSESEGLRVVRAHQTGEGLKTASGIEQEPGPTAEETAESLTSAESTSSKRIADSEIIKRCLAEVIAKENPETSG